MKKILVGISGASGAPIAIRLLKRLREMADVETHLIMTKGAELTIVQETDCTVEQVKALADVVYDVSSLGECPASGSFKMDAMIIVPCSMKTAAGIASGYSDNLLLRAADVTLKEARQLVLVARESPLSPVHLRNLHELSSMGVRVVPPMISFYRLKRGRIILRNGCWKYWDYIIQCNPGAECRERRIRIGGVN